MDHCHSNSFARRLRVESIRCGPWTPRVAFPWPWCFGSKNLFPNFGTFCGESIERSDPDPQFSRNSLPAHALRTQRGNSVSIQDHTWPAEALALGAGRSSVTRLIPTSRATSCVERFAIRARTHLRTLCEVTRGTGISTGMGREDRARIQDSDLSWTTRTTSRGA